MKETGLTSTDSEIAAAPASTVARQVSTIGRQCLGSMAAGRTRWATILDEAMDSKVASLKASVLK